MKKILILAFAIMLAVSLCTAVCADSLVRVLMSTDGTVFENASFDQLPTMEELNAAVENSVDVIPEDVKFISGRLTLMHCGHVAGAEEVYDISLKVWSTANRAIGLFFKAEDADSWELISCNLGDVIEGRLETAGLYAVAVGW